MKLLFQGGDELVELHIDRERKELKVSSSKTNYQLTSAPWTKLFDPGKEELQEKVTDKLDNRLFKNMVIISMAQQGYTLKNDGHE